MNSNHWTRKSRHRFWLCPLLVLVFVGCAGTKERDILESRLRHQEDMLTSYQAQIDRVKTELDIARRESASLREQLASGEMPVAPAEHISTGFRVTELAFSTLMTGGTNINSSPGDDGLTVVLLPRDPDGQVVKVAGTIEIEAFDLSRPEGDQRIGHWQYDSSESHQHWHQGVIQPGYQFQLPWQEQPRAEKILLHGRLTSIDGRQYDATHTVSIDPPRDALVEGRPTEVSARPPITQLSAFDESLSAVRPADAESSSTAWEDEPTPAAQSAMAPETIPPNESGIAQPFGHSAAVRRRLSEARAMTGAEFADQLSVSSPLTVGPAAPPRQIPVAPPFAADMRGLEDTSAATNVSSPAGSAGVEPRPFPAEPEAGSDFDREIPPSIVEVPQDAENWWGADDWPSEPSPPAATPPVRTSDVWTDETIPYRR